MAKSKDETSGDAQAELAEVGPSAREEFQAQLRAIRARVEHHAHRGEVEQLGYAVRDLIDLVMT